MRLTKTGNLADLASRTTIAATRGGGESFHAEITSPYFASKDDADAYAGQFPKSIRARTSTLSGLQDSEGRRYFVYVVSVSVSQTATKTTGLRNETGATRLRRAIKTLQTNGVEIVPVNEAFASSMSVDDLRAEFLGAAQ